MLNLKRKKKRFSILPYWTNNGVEQDSENEIDRIKNLIGSIIEQGSKNEIDKIRKIRYCFNIISS